MENSLIIKFFTFIIKKFLVIYNNSGLEKIINSVCCFFKKKSSGSVVCRYFANNKNAGGYWKNSSVFKIVTFPVRLLMLIYEKCSLTINKLFKNSSILSVFDNILNIRICNYSKGLWGYVIGAALGLLISRDFNILNCVLVGVLAVLAFVGIFIPATPKALCSSSKLLKLFGSLFNRYNIKTDEYPVHNIGNIRPIFLILLVAGIFLGMISLLYAFAAILGVVGVLFLLNNTVLGIFLIVIAAPLMPTMVCAGLVVLCVLSFGLKLLLGKEKLYTITQPSLFIVGFLLMALFSSLTSFNIAKSLQSYILYFVFALSYFLIVNNIKTKNQWYNLVVVFVLTGLLVALYGVYQNYFVTITDTSWIDEDMFEEIQTRVYSTFDNPNVLGQYLVMVIPVTFALMWSDKRLGAKAVYAGIAVVMTACLIFTWSRAAWVAIVLAIGFFMVMKDRRWASLLVVALLILPFVLPESILSRITSIGNMKDSSTAYRFSVWMSSLRMACDYWLSGIGLGAGAFERVYQKYALNGAGFALHAHNFYIQLVVEMGILGIILFALIIISSYRKIISIKETKSSNKNVALAMGGALLGYLFQGIAENLWYNYRMILLFFIFLGILHSGANLASSKPVCEIDAHGIKE